MRGGPHRGEQVGTPGHGPRPEGRGPDLPGRPSPLGSGEVARRAPGRAPRAARPRRLRRLRLVAARAGTPPGRSADGPRLRAAVGRPRQRDVRARRPPGRHGRRQHARLHRHRPRGRLPPPGAPGRRPHRAAADQGPRGDARLPPGGHPAGRRGPAVAGAVRPRSPGGAQQPPRAGRRRAVRSSRWSPTTCRSWSTR